MSAQTRDLSICSDTNGNFDGKLTISSNKYDQLSIQAKRDIDYEMTNKLKEIYKAIALAWVQENQKEERLEHVKYLTGLFRSAGFFPIYTEIIPNEYCEDTCCYKKPWVVCTTQYGRIKLGWRKRVINLDWSALPGAPESKTMFEKEDVTKGNYYIHCWSESKAVEYLAKIKETYEAMGDIK